MTHDFDIFFSYNWGIDESGRDNISRVSIINKGLKELGYKTYFDLEEIGGNIAEKLSIGIMQAKVILVFITQRYAGKMSSAYSNDNCKLEFLYASKMKTLKMVPVVMETGMRDAERWTGLIYSHLSHVLYVDMSGDLDDKLYLSERMKCLQKELQCRGIQPPQGISFCFTFQSFSD